MNSTNVAKHRATVTRGRREKQNRHKGVIIWFTGLSGSGKSTIAHVVEEELHRAGCRTFVFDGDNVRHGLCANLGFSEEDRHENIRRIGEMAKLFLEAGVIALTAFITPFRADRDRIRALVSENDLIEIFCDSPLSVCEERDVKGLYKKARAGEIKNYTGISSPYEKPEHPDLVLDTAGESVEANVKKILRFLEERHTFSQK